jgi:hypothetical protein
MKENSSLGTGKCCTDWLNQIFHSVIRQVLFLRSRQVLPHLGQQLFAAGRAPNRKSEYFSAWMKPFATRSKRRFNSPGSLTKNARMEREVLGLNSPLYGKHLVEANPLGRGPRGRGRGHNKGTITMTMRASKRQKEPSIALIFYKLPLSCAMSRQRSIFHSSV